MKLKTIAFAMLLMLTLSLSFAVAEEDTDRIDDSIDFRGKGPMMSNGPKNAPEFLGMENPFKLFREDALIETLMEKYDLTEDNTIGDLLDAIGSSQDELNDEMQERWIERAREMHGLDDSMTDEEVEDYVLDQRRENTIEMLGLDEGATDEEILTTLQEQRPSHKGFFGNFREPSRGLFRGFF
ncbi:hypothetical protein J4477_00495 [Candidatus Pacearchaeota archaeon]|nr:hypothetical protein [Candidatus Pacearchaeota archaeon]